MRSRRRIAHAAALPASRLPVGTPQLGPSLSPPPPPRTSSSPSSLESHVSSLSSDTAAPRKINTADISKIGDGPPYQADMAPPANSNDVAAMSIAEAKLQRQKKRIGEADAALAAPLPLDRRAQTSRGKGKQWKPFDFTAESNHSPAKNDGGVPVEVRVNTFRAASRGRSLSRSMSITSHQTSETGPSDMERQDSALIEQGFRVINKGRRNRKNVEELSAYEDKPEERQTTVEATFDKREIYNVFGNALPSQEYLEENLGSQNGQLQFVQHPNGDVSAHQWSTHRYMWENIGQFSNIRKKTEGQLGSDRLKGETTYQTLQQNTLAYFRIIAKQREANVMGMPFGPKVIQAALPEPKIELAAAPTGLKEALLSTAVAPHTEQEDPAPTPSRPWTVLNAGPPMQSQLSQRPAWDQHPFVPTTRVPNITWQSASQERPQSTSRSDLPQNVPLGPRADRLHALSSYSHQTARQEDPFYSAVTPQQNGHGYPLGHFQTARGRAPRSHFPVSQNSQGLDYNFHFPPARSNAGPSQNFDEPSYSGAFHSQFVGQPQQSYTAQVNQQIYHAGMYEQRTITEVRTERDAESSEILAPRPTRVTPNSSHSAIRDQLWKVADNAKERSLSQANIRTVLYDPYQNQQPAAQAEPEKEPVKQEVSPTFARNVQGKTLQPPAGFDPTSVNFFPTVLAPGIQVGQNSSSPAGSVIENDLLDSSPDRDWMKRPADYSTPLVAASSTFNPTPQLLNGPHAAPNQDPQFRIAWEQSKAALQRAQDEELKQWWNSGSNNFSRQEELFQTIKAAHKTEASTSSPPAHLTPIGPPSRNTPTKKAGTTSGSIDEITTRMLIPVLENLASYVSGPIEKRRDYFSQWSQPPEWAIDRSENGNKSFYDEEPGNPPVRPGRDLRYGESRPWSGGGQSLADAESGGRTFVGVVGAGSSVGVVGGGIDRRFAFGGRY